MSRKQALVSVEIFKASMYLMLYIAGKYMYSVLLNDCFNRSG